MATGLEWHITGLIYPDYTMADVEYFGRIADPQDGEVSILLNDSRLAKITVSAWDPLVGDIVANTYERCLKAYYNGQLVFWGVVNLAEPDFATGNVVINALDPSVRLIHHFLRRGDLDGDLSAAHHDKGTVTVDHLGLRLLRDAALNTAGQTARGDPDIGIKDGTNTFAADPDTLMGVSRGDQAWSTMQQLAASLGPDFELEPIETTDGYYAQLNTYDRQGSDISDTVVSHYGTGRQNLDGLAFTIGSKYITHVHALDRDGLYRVTSANTDTARFTGPYVEWDATDFDGKQAGKTATQAVLAQYGQEVLHAYGRPLLIVNATLPIENDDSYHYGTDYGIGDTIGIAGRIGNTSLVESDYRITRVTLSQDNASNGVRPSIEVVADQTTYHDDDLTDTEEQ